MLKRFLAALSDFSPEEKTPWFLAIRRHIRRCRQALFGAHVPHWVSSGYKSLRWLNLFELLPTLAVILLSPWHFFRRLPQVLEEKKPWYKTPLPFFSTLAVYTVLLIKHFASPEASRIANDLSTYASSGGTLVHSAVGIIVQSKESPTVLLATFALLSPLWVPVICLAMSIVTFLYETVRAISQTSGLSRYIPLPILNPFLYLVPLDLQTYLRLRPSRFLWGLFYFGLLAILALFVFVLALYVLALVFLDASSTSSGDRPTLPFGDLIFGVLLWFFQRIFVFPYVCMLRTAAKGPTRLMCKSDAYVNVEIFKRFLDFAPQVNLGRSKMAPLSSFFLNRVSLSWEKYRAIVIAEEQDLRRSAPEGLIQVREYRSVPHNQAARLHSSGKRCDQKNVPHKFRPPRQAFSTYCKPITLSSGGRLLPSFRPLVATRNRC